jgi:hypothetical protein
MILFLSVLVALTIWAVLASIVAMRTDGFGDADQALRNRHPEPFPRGR